MQDRRSAWLASHPGAGAAFREEDPLSFVSPVDEGPTLEVRWICSGALTTSMIDWFGASSIDIETREDVYLVAEGVRGLSVKIRGGTQLDLKVARGSRGVLAVPGRARGELESWQKWAFPLPSMPEGTIGLADWIPVRKVRRIRMFSRAGDAPVEHAQTPSDGAWCAVELTDVSVDDEQWWTLGFEAAGSPGAMRGALDAAVALVFGHRLPDGSELTVADSISYMDWLRTGRPERGRPS